MANSGYKQAAIAYKVDAATGEPLDIDGNRTAVSGKKQAILLLAGRSNPDAGLYEVQGYFSAGQVLAGTPTKAWDPENCPTGTISVDPARVVVLPSSEPFQIIVFSSGPWSLDATNPLAAFSQTSGPAGFNYITVTPSATEGQHNYYFKNLDTNNSATFEFIISANPDLWILADGTWNNAGFWFDDGLWNY